MAHFNQYRVSSAVMPNPDKIKSKELLKAKIQEVTDARAGKKVPSGEKAPTDSTTGRSTGLPGSNIHSLSSTPSSSNSSRKKVVKKPPPNFGGGKLGSS